MTLRRELVPVLGRHAVEVVHDLAVAERELAAQPLGSLQSRAALIDEAEGRARPHSVLTGRPTLMIRSIRLERAAELLRQKTGSVAEIAYIVGFSSQAYFAKCFREQFGCSPKEYAMAANASPSPIARFPRSAWRVHRHG